MVIGIKVLAAILLSLFGVFGIYSSIKAKAYDSVLRKFNEKKPPGQDWKAFNRAVEVRSDTLFLTQLFPAIVFFLLTVVVGYNWDKPWGSWSGIFWVSLVGVAVVICAGYCVRWVLNTGPVAPSQSDLREWKNDMTGLEAVAYLAAVFRIFTVILAATVLIGLLLGADLPSTVTFLVSMLFAN